MAFRAPPNRRHLSIQSIPPFLEDEFQDQTTYSPLLSSPGVRSPAVEQDADEWVVFSPSSVGDTTVTGTNPPSRASEVGSLESAPRILRHGLGGGGGGNYGFPGPFEELEEDDEDEEDDDDDYLDGTETDSLQPFRELDNEGPVMLPTHDGLGMFPSSSGVISGLRSLEESLRIVAMAGHTQVGEDTDAKIERWRIEHSQALLDEIEKVTRRKMSVASLRGGSLDPKEVRNLLDDGPAFMGPRNSSAENLTSSSASTVQSLTQSMEENQETLWRRITRRFIRDIMGIDDELLQVIFGEALPASDTPTGSLHEESKSTHEAEERLLNRLARELGVLVNQYTSHPAGEGAFSTHRGSYENDDGIQTPQPRSLWEEDEHTKSPRKRQRSGSLTTSESSSVPQFKFAPTLSHQDEVSHAALWGIEEEEQEVDEETQAKRDSQTRKEYWEQELGVRVFFSFLKSRFSRPSSDASNASSSSSSSPPPPPAPIHQHHPLIKRSSPTTFQAGYHLPRRTPSSASISLAKTASPTSTSTEGQVLFGLGVGMRSGSSLLSQSTKGKGVGSGKKTLSSMGSGRSRNRGYYWDVASSVGSGKTGSCIGTGVWAAI